MPEDAGRRARHVRLVFAVALVVRLAVFFAGPAQDQNRAFNGDSTRYVILASSLTHYGVFRFDPKREGFTHREIQRLRVANGTAATPDAHLLLPDGFRTPGYPVFLVLGGAGFGDVRLALLLQLIVGAFCAVGAMHAARACGLATPGERAVGWLWALHPAIVLYDNTVATETLFNACVMAAWVVASRSMPRRPLLSGIMLGLAAIVRPLIGLFFVPSIFVLFRRQTPRRAISATVVATIVAASFPALWAVRNAAVGEGLRVSWVGEMNLFCYNLPFTLAEEQRLDWSAGWPERVHAIADTLQTRLKPGEDVPAAARRYALAELAARPVPAAKVAIKSLIKVLLDHSLVAAFPLVGKEYQPTGLLASLQAAHGVQALGSPTIVALVPALAWSGLNALLILGMLGGVVIALRARDWGLLLACGVPIALFLGATGGVGVERMRLPIMLPLFILNGVCLDRWRASREHRAARSATPAR